MHFRQSWRPQRLKNTQTGEENNEKGSLYVSGYHDVGNHLHFRFDAFVDYNESTAHSEHILCAMGSLRGEIGTKVSAVNGRLVDSIKITSLPCPSRSSIGSFGSSAISVAVYFYSCSKKDMPGEIFPSLEFMFYLSWCNRLFLVL